VNWDYPRGPGAETLRLADDWVRAAMWLFENPVAIWCTGAVFVALAVFVYLQLRTKEALIAILVIVLATVMLLVVERLIVTPREEVQQTLNDLAARIAANDLPGVITFIEPEAKAVRADAESLMPLVTVHRASIMGTPEIAVNMATSPPTATVDCQGLVEVTVKQNSIKGPYMDRVQIHFVREGECWLIDSYTPAKDWHHGVGR
jgi:hypothetical protein